jgi:mRNA interferase RelE/StbE
MSYWVEFLSSAEREFLRLPLHQRERIGKKIEELAENPRPPGCLKMSGAWNLWRIRVGAYRVLYSIEEGPRIVGITKVARRRESFR